MLVRVSQSSLIQPHTSMPARWSSASSTTRPTIQQTILTIRRLLEGSTSVTAASDMDRAYAGDSCGSDATSSRTFSWADETTTAPSSDRPSDALATIACHGGSRSRRSRSTSAPSITLTTGFATETVATDGTSLPVESESCWNRNPTIPAAAHTQNSQLATTSTSPSVWRFSTTGFIIVADRP